jgi:NAD(P)-dependent dehydrogenase (short-subunit alcohol dehydrogenase family)
MDRPRTALVTGASRGLGLETCRQLAERGLAVILTSRSSSGEAAAKRLGVELGADVRWELLDVADPGSVTALADRLARVTLDVLVNNAGISMSGFDAHVARGTLDVNFFGALRVTEALLPRLADGGNIVMVSSGMGELSVYPAVLRERFLDPALTRPGLVELLTSFVRAVEDGRHVEAGWPSSAYRVSKAGLNALARILGRELAGRHIRVNAVCPGWVRTDMGGRSATRSVEQGAASIVWAAAAENGPTGGFFRDGRPIAW